MTGRHAGHEARTSSYGSRSSRLRNRETPREPTPPTATAALTVRGLRKAFDGVPVLRGLDLDVASGEIVSVTGPSGAGKTTLLRMISGDEEADAGSITVAGTIMVDDRTDVPASRRPVVSVSQGATLLDDRQVATFLALALPRRERTKRDGAARVAEMFDLVGLPTELADRRPTELSISERQRVLLARALIARPQLLLLDEPFFAFDPSTRARLRPELRDVLHAAGVGTVLVSHHDRDLADVADRRWRLADGRLVSVER